MPFISDAALAVEPGTYTLVIWVDQALGSRSRWVPISTGRRGLYGDAGLGIGADFEEDVTAGPTGARPIVTPTNTALI